MPRVRGGRISKAWCRSAEPSQPNQASVRIPPGWSVSIACATAPSTAFVCSGSVCANIPSNTPSWMLPWPFSGIHQSSPALEFSSGARWQIAKPSWSRHLQWLTDCRFQRIARATGMWPAGGVCWVGRVPGLCKHQRTDPNLWGRQWLHQVPFPLLQQDVQQVSSCSLGELECRSFGPATSRSAANARPISRVCPRWRRPSFFTSTIEDVVN